MILAGASLTLGACFSDGRAGGNDNVEVIDLKAVCAMLAGPYVREEFRRFCTHDDHGTKWDFDLTVNKSTIKLQYII